MLGKLEDRIELNLDVAVARLKVLKKDLPNNLYELSSKQEMTLREMLAIIEGVSQPERIGNMYE